MDQLQQLVKTLRVLARTNEPNRVALVEKAIDGYARVSSDAQDHAAQVEQSLKWESQALGRGVTFRSAV
jgi:hypothetical protein